MRFIDGENAISAMLSGICSGSTKRPKTPGEVDEPQVSEGPFLGGYLPEAVPPSKKEGTTPAPGSPDHLHAEGKTRCHQTER